MEVVQLPNPEADGNRGLEPSKQLVEAQLRGWKM
jgi:hypothetical protein